MRRRCGALVAMLLVAAGVRADGSLALVCDGPTVAATQGVQRVLVRQFAQAAGSLEELRFVKLKGDFLKLFLTDAHRLCRSRGKLLAMNTSWDAVDPATAGRMFIPADDLCREQVVDELSVLAGANADLTRWRVLGQDRVRLTTFTGLHSPKYGVGRAQWVQGLQQMLRNPTLDGVCFHEFGNVSCFDLWEEIGKAVAAWKAEGGPAPQ